MSNPAINTRRAVGNPPHRLTSSLEIANSEAARVFNLEMPDHVAMASSADNTRPGIASNDVIHEPRSPVQSVCRWICFGYTPDALIESDPLETIRKRSQLAGSVAQNKVIQLLPRGHAATWVTSEELEQIETRQRRLRKSLLQLRLQRGIAIALAALSLGVVAHLTWNDSSATSKSPAEPVANAMLATIDQTQVRMNGVAMPASLAGDITFQPGLATSNYVAADELRILTIESPTSPLTSAERLELELAKPLSDWQNAWQSQDIEAYLAAYSADFSPANGMPHAAWVQNRRDRVLAPKQIRLSVEQVSFSETTPGRAESRFIQNYRNGRYADQSEKRIGWVKQDGRWLIESESTGKTTVLTH